MGEFCPVRRGESNKVTLTRCTRNRTFTPPMPMLLARLKGRRVAKATAFAAP
jgi:hypothetical protein